MSSMSSILSLKLKNLHLRLSHHSLPLFLFMFGLSLFGTLSCTFEKNPSSPTPGEKKTVNLFVWPNYVSTESIEQFENQTGLKVNIAHFASNEELLAKLQAGAQGYDLLVPSDYMVRVMIQLGLLEPLQAEFLTNKNSLDAFFLGKDFDPHNEYSLPYGWATTGIAYSKKHLPQGIKSWKELMERPELKGKVGLLDDTREVFALALRKLNYSLNSKDEKEIKEAHAYLVAHKNQVTAYLSDPMEAILKGEVWATQMYSPDALQAKKKSQGQIEYVIPEEGSTFSIDNLVIPKTAQNKDGAHRLLNFLISEDSNRRFVERIFAGPVVKSTKSKLSKELQNERGLFPPDPVFKKLEMLQDLGQTNTLYDRLWTELKVSL